MSEVGYDSIIELVKSILLEINRLNKSLYAAKSMIKPLGGYQKINIYPMFCMLYYNEDVNLIKCKTYRHARYKPNAGRGRSFVIYL